MARTVRRPAARRRRLTVDQALIAVLVSAMDANEHVSPDEAERAHHIIWSMRRFRHETADAVNLCIDTVRTRMEQDGTGAVLLEAARSIPPKLRLPAFAVAVDLMLSDNKLEREERTFVRSLAAGLKIRPEVANAIVRVMLIKNSA